MPDISYYLEKIPANAPPEVYRRMVKEAEKKVETDVFGHGFRRDKAGRPIEQGLGSLSNMTKQSIDAYVKWHGPDSPEPDPNFKENHKIMQDALIECDARRKALRDAGE